MKPLSSLLDPLRRFSLPGSGLRPAYPPVAVEIDRREMVLVRLRRRGRGKPQLDAHQVRAMPDGVVGSSIFRPNLGPSEEMGKKMRELFEASGTRPGRVSLVLPDNLAKISLLSLPERPASHRHLSDLVRFKLRRAVPFRLEDAVITHQVLPGEGRGVTVLVALMLRSVVEQYERVLEAAGARPGLVDLCTPNLFNLCRSEIGEAAAQGRDVALLNLAPGYFSLLIVRGDRLIFYRCKSYAVGDEDVQSVDALVDREIATSLSYYREKLGGESFARVLVRSVDRPVSDVATLLDKVGVDSVQAVDPARALGAPEGVRLDPLLGQRIAPAVGAAAGRAG